MEIAVVGQLEFTLGFQLAGVKNLYNPSDDEELQIFFVILWVRRKSELSWLTISI